MEPFDDKHDEAIENELDRLQKDMKEVLLTNTKNMRVGGPDFTSTTVRCIKSVMEYWSWKSGWDPQKTYFDENK